MPGRARARRPFFGSGPVPFALVLLGGSACGGVAVTMAEGAPSDGGSELDDAGPSTRRDGGDDATVGAVDAAADAAAPADAGSATDAPSHDAATCGPCAGTCFGVRCLVVLASGEATPTTIAVTSTGVYWTNEGRPDTQYAESAVRTVGLNGGTASTVAATPGANSSAVVADDRNVVWSTWREIDSVPTGATFPVTTIASNLTGANVALDERAVYWTAYAPGGTIAEAWRRDRDGGPPVRLQTAPGMPELILATGGDVVWQTYGANYATTISIVRSDGGAPRTLVTGEPSGLFPWAALGGSLYFAHTSNPLQIRRVSLDGGEPTVFAHEVFPVAMTSDARQLYFTEDNAVYALATDGGAPDALAWRFPHPYGIAVDATSVYFTDRGTCDASACTGAILKLTPK